MEQAQSIVLSIIANAIFAFLGWLIKTWVVDKTGSFQPQTHSSESLAQLIDRYVKAKQTAVQRNRLIRVEQRIVIEHRSESSNDNSLGYILLLIIAMVALSSVWQRYKVHLFWITVVGVTVGWASSFYFATILNKIPGRHRIEDKLLAYGSMLIWAFSIFALYFGVYQPFYPDSAVQQGTALSIIQGSQLVGAAFVYISIIITATLQFVAGSIYRKAVKNRLPNRFEVFTWSNYKLGMVISAFSLVFGFLIVTSLWFRLMPG